MICLLFLPATIQIAHAFESHEHVICSSDTEHHLHEDDIECFLCHLQAETHLVAFDNNYDVIPSTFYNTSNEVTPFAIAKVYLHKKSSRAPPFLLFYIG